MLYVGLDLSRKRLDFDALRFDGERVDAGALPPDGDGLAKLVLRLGDADDQVLAVIESMNGARFVHDQLELAGWDVRIADALKVKGLAPLACKTDKIDCWVLAELARRDLVPEIWLPDPAVRAERERARFRLHLVKHRTSLKNRVHSILIAHGVPNPLSDLFGLGGRRLLARLALPEPWRSTMEASLALIDVLDEEIAESERELRRLGADHAYVPLLMTCPGIGWILGYTIDDRMKLLIDCEEDRTLGGIGTIDKLLDEWQSQIALDRRRSRCATHSWRSTLPRAVAPLPGAARRARGLRKRIDGESIHRAAKRYGELHERGISRHT